MSLHVNRSLCPILMKLEFSGYIFKITQILNLMKIHPVGADLVYADRRAEMMNLIVAFRDFV